MTKPRPRGAVIRDAWLAAAIDAPDLVNKQGLPLARTVKTIVDPLIIRPRQRKHLAAALLDEAAAAEITGLLGDARPALTDASRWYRQLKGQRRALGITAGNAQELYFPPAFSLAKQFGSPEGHDNAIGLCRELLAELHEDRPSQDQLKELLADAALIEEADEELARDWSPPPPTPAAVDKLLELLRAAAETRDHDAWERFAEDGAADILGAYSRTDPQLLARIASTARLTRHETLSPPPVLADETADLPLDRPVAARARAAVRRHRASEAPPGVEKLWRDEVQRARSPWGLNHPDLQAVFLLGVAVAATLDALRPVPGASGLIADTQAVLSQHAYVMRARREITGTAVLHPRQQGILPKLREFWHPYLNRLWARLHGLDVTALPPMQTADVRDLITGAAQSTALDIRSELRATLQEAPGGEQHDQHRNAS